MSIPTNPAGIDHPTPPFAEMAGTYASRETEYPGTHSSFPCGGAMRMETIELYTRPGCPFCFTLRRRLRKHGIEFREINIWNDPDARDRVRAAGNGNETVPTAHIGDRWLLNPTIKDVAAQIRWIDSHNSSAVTQDRGDGRRNERAVLPSASTPVSRPP